MTAFYLQIDCAACGEEQTVPGLAVSTLTDGDTPVIPLAMFSQVAFTCEECGAENFTDDLDDHVYAEEADQ